LAAAAALFPAAVAAEDFLTLSVTFLAVFFLKSYFSALLASCSAFFSAAAFF